MLRICLPTGPARLLKKGTGTTTNNGLARAGTTCWGASPLFQHSPRTGGGRFRNYAYPTCPPPTDDVKLKRFGIGLYVHRATRDNTVWYDDVALSTGYIEPVKRESQEVTNA
jgi:hypothetical protein